VLRRLKNAGKPKPKPVVKEKVPLAFPKLPLEVKEVGRVRFRQEVIEASKLANQEVSKLKQSFSEKQRFRNELRTQQLQIQKQRARFPLFSVQSQQILKQQQIIQQKLVVSQTELQQSQLQLQTFSQQFKQLQRLKQNELQRITQREKIREKLVEIPKIPFVPLVEKVKLKRKLIKVALKKGGYDVFVKSKGVFKRVNINPLGKKKAHDLGSWLVDRSTARTWKRKQVPFKAQKPILKVPSAYFKKTRIKYRGRKIKGKVQPLKNLGIEKRKFAIDTKREKQQLSAARVRAELLRKVGLKKPRKIPLGLKATKLIKFKRQWQKKNSLKETRTWWIDLLEEDLPKQEDV
ncbi:hypothetical protein LCGC14_3093400, partial [marine sediment metagenome]